MICSVIILTFILRSNLSGFGFKLKTGLRVILHFITCHLPRWYTNQRVTSYELISIGVAFIARVASYELFLLHELRVTFCIQVTSYCLLHELRVTFCIKVTSYCLLHEFRVTFYIQVTSYCLFDELRATFIIQVTNYYLFYELLLILRVASFCLLHELRVTFCIRFTSYCLFYKLQVTFWL